jgi:hypothetical protein
MLPRASRILMNTQIKGNQAEATILVVPSGKYDNIGFEHAAIIEFDPPLRESLDLWSALDLDLPVYNELAATCV